MGIPLDNISRKKLILVRQLFQRAQLQAASQYSYVDRIMALIGFDLSNETLLKTVISALSGKPNPDGKFHEIIEKANKLLISKDLVSVPDEGKIKYVRNLRNDAQHQTRYPNETDLNDCRTYTRDFLSATIRGVWGVDFESISLIDIIQASDVKNLLLIAKDELQQRNFDEVAFHSVAAFNQATASVRPGIVGRNKKHVFASETSSEFVHIKQTIAEVESLRHLLMYVILGLDIKSFRKYKDLTRGIVVSSLGGGKFDKALLNRGRVSEEEANNILEFVTNAITQIESLVGNIKKPFKIDSLL